MPHIRTDNQPVTQITVIEPEPGKQAEALSLMFQESAPMPPRHRSISASVAKANWPSGPRSQMHFSSGRR